MKSTLALSLLVASAAAFPAIFSRQDAVNDLANQFKALSNKQQADFLEQISDDQNVNIEATPSDDANSTSSNGNDVLANVNAVAADDGQANVSVKDSDDIQVNADVQALDDGIVNLNIQGLEDVQMSMALKTTNGAVANVTVDKGSVKGWGKDGGALCAEGLNAKRVVASMGFCVPN